MREKFAVKTFGECPRIQCQKQAVLPFGLSQELGKGFVYVFCAKCCEIYKARKGGEVDGASYGPNFVHLFFQEFKELLPERGGEAKWPKVFGFRVKTQR